MIGHPLPIKHDLAFFKAEDLKPFEMCLNTRPPRLSRDAEAILLEIADCHRKGFTWPRVDRDSKQGDALHDLYCEHLVSYQGHREYYLALRGLVWLRSRGVDVSRPAPIMAVQPSLFGGAP